MVIWLSQESYTLPLLQYGAMALTRVVYFAFTAAWCYGYHKSRILCLYCSMMLWLSQESYTLPLLQHGAMALTRVVYFAFTAVWCYGSQITKSQLEDLNVCWNLVYRKIFGVNKFDSVRCFIAGLVRPDFYHLHLFLSLRFIKCAYFSSNAVFKSLFHLHRLTAEFKILCSVAGITNIEFDRLPVSSLKYLTGFLSAH